MINLTKLFFEFIYVGLLSFGGGYATIPLIENRIIAVHHWISLREFVDMITISQMTPGPLTVNVSTFVGYTFAGPPGSIVATLGSAIPGVLMTLFMIHQYEKHHNSKIWNTILKSLRISAAALIAIATVHIGRLVFNEAISSSLIEIIFTIGLVLIALKKNTDPLVILLISAIFGFVFF